jgi:hypothetical protein
MTTMSNVIGEVRISDVQYWANMARILAPRPEDRIEGALHLQELRREFLARYPQSDAAPASRRAFEATEKWLSEAVVSPRE